MDFPASPLAMLWASQGPLASVVSAVNELREEFAAERHVSSAFGLPFADERVGEADFPGPPRTGRTSTLSGWAMSYRRCEARSDPSLESSLFRAENALVSTFDLLFDRAFDD